MTKPTKPNAELAELTSKLAEARAHLQQLVEGERQVIQTAFASIQNGGRASEIDRFKNEQLGLLREPLATARKMVDDIESQIKAIKSAEAASRSKARRSDVAATIEADRKEVEKLRSALKDMAGKRADLDMQLIDARAQRLKVASDADDLIREQGLALSSGGKFDDTKIKSVRADAVALADRVKAFEIAVQDMDNKIKSAKEDLTLAERGLSEMLNVKRLEDDAKAFAAAVQAFKKAGGTDAKHLASVVIDAISAGVIPKPDNSWKLDNSHLLKVGV